MIRSIAGIATDDRNHLDRSSILSDTLFNYRVQRAFTNRVTTSTYDLVNNTTTVHRPEGVVETTKLDSVGNVKSVTTTVKGENRTTAYQYNGLNQVSRITAPPANALVAGNIQTFEYAHILHQYIQTSKSRDLRVPMKGTPTDNL